MKHQWWVWHGLTCCERCGTVQNDKNRDADTCKGVVKVGLRADHEGRT